jgi:hypothetical protein
MAQQIATSSGNWSAKAARAAEHPRSAMSMLLFCINRAGKNLDDDQRLILEQLKDDLRALHGKGRDGICRCGVSREKAGIETFSSWTKPVVCST